MRQCVGAAVVFIPLAALPVGLTGEMRGLQNPVEVGRLRPLGNLEHPG